MARIEARLAAGTLTLAADGAGSISTATASDPSAPLRPVSVWKSEGLHAEDCGPAASAWLTAFLGVKSHLVRIGPRFSRPMLKSTARAGDFVSFADAYPFLALSEASLAHRRGHHGQRDRRRAKTV